MVKAFLPAPQQVDQIPNLTSVGEDSAGNLYAVSLDSGVYELR